jgi:hypothetical protein
MEVIGRDRKFMQQKRPLATILRQNVHQELRHAIRIEEVRAGRLSSRSTSVLG